MIFATGKPVVVLLTSGSPLAVNWSDKHIPAIIQVWYPGAEGGTALADVLFGDYCPAGRLPVTFVKSMDDLPPFEEYSMKGRTYRYLEKESLYPFGFGLSYTTFTYRSLELSSHEIRSGEDIEITVELENTGDTAGDEVIQVYIKDVTASVCVPNFQLCGVKRVYVEPGSKKRVNFVITARQMALIDNNGECLLEPGRFNVYVGGSQPDPRSLQLMEQTPLAASFEVTGERVKLKY